MSPFGYSADAQDARKAADMAGNPVAAVAIRRLTDQVILCQGGQGSICVRPAWIGAGMMRSCGPCSIGCGPG